MITELALYFILANGTGYTPPQLVDFPILCGHDATVVGVQVDTLTDPTRVLFLDPENPTKHCEVDISARVATLPAGSYHIDTSLVIMGDGWKGWAGPDPHSSPQWTRSGTVTTTSGQQSTSADGATVPPLTQIVDDKHAVWTFAPDKQTLRDGQPAAGGFGSQYLWLRNQLYTFGLNSVWYKWSGVDWVGIGPNPPPVVTPPVVVPPVVDPKIAALQAQLDAKNALLDAAIARAKSLSSVPKWLKDALAAARAK